MGLLGEASGEVGGARRRKPASWGRGRIATAKKGKGRRGGTREKEARERVDRAAAMAEDLAGIDSDLQASSDTLQHAQLKVVALRYAAAGSYVAEQRAVRGVFKLRVAEHSLADAHALMLRERQRSWNGPGCWRAADDNSRRIGKVSPCQTRMTRRVRARHLGRRHSSRCDPSHPRSRSRRQCRNRSRSRSRPQGHRHANLHRGRSRFSSRQRNGGLFCVAHNSATHGQCVARPKAVSPRNDKHAGPTIVRRARVATA
jgi:hypothetical protein